MNEFSNFFASIGYQVSRHLNKSFPPSFLRDESSMYLNEITAREVGEIILSSCYQKFDQPLDKKNADEFSIFLLQ